MSRAASPLRGDGGLSFLRFALNASNVGEWVFGSGSAEPTAAATASASGARRIVIAVCWAYHRFRALWRAAGGRRHSDAQSPWVYSGTRMVAELATIVRDDPGAVAPHRCAPRSGRERNGIG